MFNDKYEELAYFTALKKVIDEHVSELKNEAKGYLMAVNEETGLDRMPITVGGEKVGQVAITYNSAQLYVINNEGYEYLHMCGLVKMKPAKGWEKRFSNVAGKVIDTLTGEDVSDKFGWLPRSPKTAAVTGCKPDEVAAAFNQLQLPEIKPTQLLEGSVE